MITTPDRRFPRGLLLRIMVALMLIGIGAAYVFLRVPPITGITMSIENDDAANNYFSAALGADGYYNPRDSTHTLADVSPSGVVTHRFAHRLRPAHQSMRLRFGSKPDVHRIKFFSFDNVLLFWNFPLAEWPVAELADAAKPVRDIGAMELKDGVLHIVAAGASPEIEVGISYASMQRSIDPGRLLMVRLLWILWGGAVICLLVFTDRLLAAVVRLVKARKQHALHYPAGYFGRVGYWILAGALFFIIANFARSWGNFTNPVLYVEDAGHYFNLYYGGGEGFSTVFQKPNRYINFLNNLVAWLAAEADVRLQPTIYLIFGITAGTVTALVLMFSGLFRNRWILLAVPLTLGLSGMNHVYYYNTLTFQMYTLIVLLLCLLLFPAPRGNWGWLLMAALISVLIWSGPYSVLVVPFALVYILLFGEHRKNLLLLVSVASTLLYFLTVEQGTTNIAGFFTDFRVQHVASVFFGDILLLGLFGEPTLAKGALLMVGLGGVLYCLRGDGNFLRISLVLWTIIITALAPYFMSIKYELFHYRPCHILISYFFWLVFLLLAADRLLQRSPYRAALSPAVFGLFAVFVVVDNVRNPEKRYFPPVEEFPRFLQTVHHYEQLDLAARDEYVILRADSGDRDWQGPGPMVVVGSRGPTARQLGPDDFPAPYGRVFVQEPLK